MNNKIGVLKLTTFAPTTIINSDNINEWDEYRELLEYAINDMNERGIKELIIDVIGNGGGYVCLSYSTLQFLIKGFEGVEVYQPYDFRESLTTEQLVRTQFISSDERYILGTESTPCGLGWYGPVNYTRGIYSLLYL